jgi:hypothetical protein
VLADYAGAVFDPALVLTSWGAAQSHICDPLNTSHLSYHTVFHGWGTEEEARAYVKAAGFTWKGN